MSENVLQEEYKTLIGDSKSLRTPAHRGMVIKFVRDQYPTARFKKIYDARIDGWGSLEFHKCCDEKGWTLTIVETTDDFIFGGFTTAEWDTSRVEKLDPHSFLFSVNEGSKYPIARGERNAIYCADYLCAAF
jgi:hypothetical protein